MKKIKVNLQNCYGIKKLEEEFDFSGSPKAYMIYAPNGVMKTSFAKVFIDLVKDEESKDLIFSDRKTIREIKDENGLEIKKEQVFVIEPYNERFNSEKVSTLLANRELKLKYDEIHKNIDEAKENLLKKLKQLSGIKTNIESEISKCFSNKMFLDIIEEIEPQILNNVNPNYSNVIYSSIFNEKSLNFFNTKNFRNQIKEYIEKYNDLLGKSKYLKYGFDHYKASTIQKNLKDNGFFQAMHSVNLFNGKCKDEVTKDEDFEKIIQNEKNNILNNQDLLKKWDEIDKKLSANNELRSLREYLLENKAILSELENLQKFAEKIWISYFLDQRDLYELLLKEYKNGKINIEKIVIDAKKQETEWKKVIDIFNGRFFVPFELKIENQDDVILKENVPNIKFIFKDSIQSIQVEKDHLLKVLSNGEKRALYILNIIFEIEARKKSNQESLLIVDDIADSFDYKNKYAIIQYLKEISEEPIFYQIILTHNFDFFRTAQSRFVVLYKNCLISSKNDNEIKLEKATGIKNPFINDWKENLNNFKKIIASIPFVRNIIEYTKGDEDENYKKLTSLLHWKNDTKDILLNTLKEIFENTISNLKFPENNLSDNVIDKIFQEADNCLSDCESINFENKIVLSIAIRLKAENFMVIKINEPAFILNLNNQNNQNFKLFKKYKEKYCSEIENLKILEEVNLMTPENIHLNSFMYEPILDMSDQHLRMLYAKLKTLN